MAIWVHLNLQLAECVINLLDTTSQFFGPGMLVWCHPEVPLRDVQ